MFGGWDRPGTFWDAVLQLLAVPLLLVGLWRLSEASTSPRFVVAFCLGLVLVPLVQLIPLPPQVWTALPGRDLAKEALVLADQEVGWRPLSLTPHGTWLSLLSLIPPLAIFFATLLLSYEERRRLLLIGLGIGVLSSFLGLLQVAQGPDGWLKEFGLASGGAAEGFFVNQNLFAAFLYSLLLFAAAFAIHSIKAFASAQTPTTDTRALITVVASLTVLVILLAAQIMARSRAGLGLTIVAMIGVAALANSDERGGTIFGAKRLIGGAVALVLLFSSQFALYRVMERFATDPLEDARVALARTTWEAVQAFLPFGSGLGSFVPVYQSFEKLQDALVDTYVNRAHNDFLEIGLETGVVGLALIAVFAIWLGRTLWQVWRSDGLGGSPLDHLLVRAATLVIVLLMAHSFVDYPLRTTAMMAVFAVACGLLFEPVGQTSDAREATEPHAQRSATRTTEDGRPSREKKEREPSLATPNVPRRPAPEHGSAGAPRREVWEWPAETPRPQAEPVARPGQEPSLREGPASDRWGQDIAWPEAWRKSGTTKKPREDADEPE